MEPKSLVFANEYIFHTVQGEGKYAGHPSVFVRLSGCNLRCAWKNPDGSITRCDTPHTSFAPEKNKKTISETLGLIGTYDCKHVVVTGGEPFLQPGVADLLNGLVDAGHYVTVETNGTLYHPNRAQFMSISPKLKNSAADPDYKHFQEKHFYVNGALRSMMVNHDYQLKFVVNGPEDIDEIEKFVELCALAELGDVNSKVVLMPQGISTEQFNERAQWLFGICKAKNWRYTDRLHVRIFGNKKGV